MKGNTNMKCKINRNAAKILQQMLSKEETKEKKIRVFITHKHEAMLIMI